MIVGSILLAFAVDAAWDLRGERSQDEGALRALAAEVELNAEELRERISLGDDVRRAQHQLIDLISPRPTLIAQDSLAQLIRTSWGFGTAELESAALEAAMERAKPTTVSRRELMRLMQRYRIELDDHEEDQAQWLGLRAELLRYVGSVAPGAFVFDGTEAHGDTDFPVPVQALLSDQRLEGLVSRLTVRSGQMVGTMRDIQAVADSVRRAAEAEIR